MFTLMLTSPSFTPLATFALLFQEQATAAEEQGGNLIFWIILAIFLTALIWWLLNRETSATHASVPDRREGDVVDQHEQHDHHDADGHEQVVQATPPVLVVPATPAEVAPAVAHIAPDDLTMIEGIGPKINQILHTAGIHTFANLAQTEVAQLRKILLDTGLRVNDPTTWPEQSALAATGRWDDLKKFQAQLKGGGRV